MPENCPTCGGRGLHPSVEAVAPCPTCSQPERWTIEVCLTCGQVVNGPDLEDGCECWPDDHADENDRSRFIEVVPASQLDKYRDALQEFVVWFDSPFPADGKNLPGLTLFGIAEKARGVLTEPSPASTRGGERQ